MQRCSSINSSYSIYRPQLQGHKASRDFHELIALKHLWSHPMRGETMYNLMTKVHEHMYRKTEDGLRVICTIISFIDRIL